MENDKFNEILDKLKLRNLFIAIKEIIQILRIIHTEKLCSPMKIRSKSKLKKSTIYNYVLICIDLKLVVKIVLPRIHEDGSRYMVMTTRKLKEFLEDLDIYAREIIT